MKGTLCSSLGEVRLANAAVGMSNAAYASGLASTTALHSQEEEEWQEVIAQQDSWQQQPAAALATIAEQQAGVPSEDAAAGDAEASHAGAGPEEAPKKAGAGPEEGPKKAGAIVRAIEDMGPLTGSEALKLNGLVCTCT